MKRGMYGEMLHLQYMSRARPMSAPRRRGSTSNRHINSSSRRKRPQSAFNLSSPTSATGCITQSSMQPLKSLPVLSTLNTKKEDEENDVVGERLRYRRGEEHTQQNKKQRPQSATFKKRETTRSGRRPQSAAPNRRTRTVQFDLERWESCTAMSIVRFERGKKATFWNPPPPSVHVDLVGKIEYCIVFYEK